MDVYHIQVVCILTGKAHHTMNSFWFQFVSKSFNLLEEHGKLTKQDGWSQKNLLAYVHKRTTSFFFTLLIWFAGRKSADANKFPCRVSAVFASDWLGYLIHIHSNRRVSLISNCLLMSEDVWFGWGPILLLKEGDAWCWKDLTLGKKSLFYINQR